MGRHITYTHFSPFLPDFWPTEYRPMAFTHLGSNKHTATHTEKIKHAAQMLREKIHRGWTLIRWRCLNADRKLENSGNKEVRGTGEITLVRVWRACSLRKTSQHCCRMLCPSGELLEPCIHECPCNTPQVPIKYILNTFYNSGVRAESDTHLDCRMRLAKSPSSLSVKAVAPGNTEHLECYKTSFVIHNQA